ncbi:MAG: GMC family oxidoreductase [Sphingomonadaceae bacterium]|nr:GMC family oxidoreductase [Sphingomonadaceae bacterium]
MVHDKRDVAIMGAGAAGSLLAARLAAAGKSVVVLDAGPPWELSDLTSSQIWARRLKWGGSPVLQDGRDRVGYNMAVGWGFGGSALHHYAGWPRLHLADFRMRSESGQGLDWPIDYDELRPWYDEIQTECGIAGDAQAETWRPPGAPYPMPPHKVTKQGRILARGFEKLGMHVSPAPMAITSIWYKGRPPCQYDGWCDAGCPIQSLLNPLVLHKPAAEKSGAEFRAYAAVTKVETDAQGRATAFYYSDQTGARHVQPASLIILAGAAVQNARLMLASTGERHPNGLGNGADLVGRYFNMHALSNAYGLFAEETECHLGMTAGVLMSQDGYPKQRSGPFGSYTWGIAPAVKPNDLIGIGNTRPDIIGNALHDFLKRASRHLGTINGIVENIAQANNRITLAAETDRNSMPLARVTHNVAPDSRALWAHANDEGVRVMRAAGATESWVVPMPVYSHVAGGTIMGVDAATSVTDSYGRVHDVANLLVAGGGLFPTIGAVSPTFTVLALAARAADRMANNWSDFVA